MSYDNSPRLLDHETRIEALERQVAELQRGIFELLELADGEVEEEQDG